MPDTDDAKIVALETRRCDALKANDGAALDALLAEDFAYVHSSGRTEDRAAYLATLAKAENPFYAFHHSDLKATPLGDAALLTGTVEIERKNGRVVFLFVEVWHQTEAGWQLKFQQNTRKAA